MAKKTTGETASRILDPLNIFGGDKSKDRALQDKLDQSRERQNQAIAELKAYIQDTAGENKDLWSEYGSGTEDYQQQLDDALSGQKGAYSQLADSLGKYSNVESLYGKGPQLAEADPQSQLAQQLNLSKISALTGGGETATELAARNNARRQLENQLKAERGAVKNSMQARGVYGGGEELTSALGAQQEAAYRRMQEDLQARAQAEQRQQQMLGLETQASGALNASNDARSRFNSALLQQNTQQQATARQADNTATQGRATALNNAATNVNVMQAQNVDKGRADQRAVTAGKTGINDAAVGQMTNITGMGNAQEASNQAAQIAQQPSKGFLEGLLSL